ncbi:MAG: arginine decarboxylase, pyruvoyl-dependent [bacterium]|nr:arginine decarboxylase, pyruvoyl-dependent [bacterium]
MVISTPTKYFMVCGCAEGFSELNAFDAALLSAGVGNTNLVRLSSILPPRCQEISPVRFPQGALVPVAYSSITSSEPGQMLTAGVAIAYPEDEDHCGLIMEHHDFAPEAVVEEQVRRMAVEGMEFRGQKVKALKSVVAGHVVKKKGAAFAAVVLWD